MLKSFYWMSPLLALDNQAQHEIIQHICTLQKEEKRCVIFSSHHLREIIELADSALCLQNGKNIGPCKKITDSFQQLEELELDNAKFSSLFIGNCQGLEPRKWHRSFEQRLHRTFLPQRQKTYPGNPPSASSSRH